VVGEEEEELVTSHAARSSRRGLGRLGAWGRPSGSDVLSGLVTGLFSIPEGMAYASIAGFDPVAGLYAGMVPTIVGSAFARSVLMVTTLTSAIALSSQSVLLTAGLDPTRPANIAALTLTVGVVMAAMGLLRFGSVMNFVSNAVMTGFTTGIALQIVVGVLGDATGYKPSSTNTIGKLLDAVTHVGSWDRTTVLVAGATVGAWAAFRLVKPVASLATLLALVVVTAAVAIFHVEVETVGDIASITSRLPPFTAPDLSVVPNMAVGAFAVALVALAQAAGIAAAVPNPDGSRTDASTDFAAQGAANLAGGLFGALPTGGSLSRTGVAVSAGARTRWAGIFAGVWLIAIVLVAGSAARIIPMPVIGGLVLVIGGELIAGRLPDIRLVLRTAPLSTAAMLVTFAATTQFPLQDAILLGAGLSLLLYCVQAARVGRLVAAQRNPDGRWELTELPERCPSRAVTVLHYSGVGLFAEVPRLDESWPDTRQTRRAVIIVSIRTLPDVPSTAMLKAFTKRVQSLHANGNLVLVSGVTPELSQLLDRSRLTALVGGEHIYQATPVLFEALDAAYDDALAWIEEQGVADDEPDPAG
jgi:SulP family sulfate permease